MAPKAKARSTKKKPVVVRDMKVKNAKDVKGGYKVGGVTTLQK
jgi:hypothetical protein